MKKIATLLLLLLSFASISSIAQNTNCNAGFNIVYQSGNTVQFNPVVTAPTANTQHYWFFGDGGASNVISPVHTYLTGTVFTVVHTIILFNPNGVEECRDSSFMTIQVQNSCTLTANFISTVTATSPYTFHFENTSTPLSAVDSSYWTFGDGSSSFDLNPNHVYTQPGTYTVCLWVQHYSTPGTVPCVSQVCHTVVVQATSNCPLIVNFTWAATSAPNTYHFTNTSTPLNNTDSIRWTFGDGSSSNLVNPTHTYSAAAGIYNVCLRVQLRDPNGGLTNCVREICDSIIVQGTPVCNLVASFYFYPDSTSTTPVANLYHFVNTSTGLSNTDSIRWTFGDGTSSNQVNPNHIYAQPGTYTVCLRVQKRDSTGTLTNCVSETCHVVVVQNPTTCNLVVNFTSTIVAGAVNTFHFTNTSTPLNTTDSIRWTFGDGTSSNQVNPTHTYTAAGTYTVCLRIQKRENGTLTNCVREICHTIVVTAPCNIQANFSWYADSANHNIIHFTNLTLSPTLGATASWSFGDGSSSTSWNPVHQYAQPGMYYVCLHVQLSPNCVSTFCDTVFIQQSLPNCIQQSNFSFIRATNNTQLFYFTPAYIDNSWQYTWTFGDGTGSHARVISHHYAQPGNYTACLTVFRDSNCASTTCRQLTAITQVNCNNINVYYTYQTDPVITNKLYFHLVSNYSIVDQLWTITKLPASSGTTPVILHQNNPAFVFQDTGYYNVCLKATTLGGCIKEYCQVIHITQVVTPTGCSLQIYPNPVTNQVNLNLFLTQQQMIDVYIYNSLNVQVREKHQQGFAGTNIVSISTATLPSGTYTMKVIHGNDICYAQFVKL